MNEDLDTPIHDALAPLRADREPSADLVHRLRVGARETARKPLWRRARFSVPVMTGAAFAAVLAVGTMLPTKASAKSFGLIVNAAQRIDAFQFSILSNDGGKRETFTIAGSDGRTVIRSDDHTIMELGAGSMSVYDPGENKVTRFKYGSLTEASGFLKEMQSGLAEGIKEMDLKKTLREYAERYGESGIRISPVVREDGRSVYHVSLASSDEPERVEMTVDAATDLPERLEVRDRDGHDSTVMEMRYGDRVDASLLRSSIPLGAKVEEIDLGALASGALKGLESLGSEPRHAKP